MDRVRRLPAVLTFLLLLTGTTEATAQDDANDTEVSRQVEQMAHMTERMETLAEECRKLAGNFESLSSSSNDAALQETSRSYKRMSDAMSTVAQHMSAMSKELGLLMANDAVIESPARLQDLHDLREHLEEMASHIDDAMEIMIGAHVRALPSGVVSPDRNVKLTKPEYKEESTVRESEGAVDSEEDDEDTSDDEGDDDKDSNSEEASGVEEDEG